MSVHLLSGAMMIESNNNNQRQKCGAFMTPYSMQPRGAKEEKG